MAVCATPAEGRARLAELVRQFKRRGTDHLAPGYNETQARTDFITPLLEAFGWDVHNSLGQPIGLREVIEEATVEVGEERLSKKPDYELRLARQRKLFVEAKKPAVRIDRDVAAAFQTRRYGFSASLPISVLTNFHQLAIYDCGPPPNEADAAHVARILIVACDEYEARFDELWALFSREAVYSGQFDARFAVGATRLGASQFDDLFLGQVRDWRHRLAVDIHQRSPALSPAELTYAVQLLISRLVFLRICEDREIETYETLRNLPGPDTYHALHGLLVEADRFYNSGLFRLIADDPLGISISDDVLRSIIAELYYPQSPYTFAVVEAEVLGEIYELFLGEEIVVAGDEVEVISKPEVRESGGVVPTPRYVVDAIVDRALAPAIAGRGPQDLEAFTVADICCGSGIFLLAAYDALLNHHLAWYLSHDPSQHVGDRIYEVVGGQWRLTFAERRRILEAHVRGVDIDSNAVEIARFSLLLKLIEDETRADLDDFVRRTREAALPSLDPTVRSGNSLVAHREWDAFGDMPADLAERINPFTWEREFPAEMARGGFDVIVGNPPYIRIQNMQAYSPEEVAYYQSARSPYVTSDRDNFDKYSLFIERALTLLQPGGRLGFIVPHKFMATQAGRSLRAIISGGHLLDQTVHFGAQQVFHAVANYTCILVLDRAGRDALTLERVINLERWRYGEPGARSIIPAADLTAEPWEMADPAAMAVFQRIRAAHPDRLGTQADIFVGLQTSADRVYVIAPLRETATHVEIEWNDAVWSIEKGIVRPFLYDTPLRAYARLRANSQIIFPYEHVNGRARLIQPPKFAATFPDCWTYLNARRAELDGRHVSGGPATEQQWYQYGRSQSLNNFNTEKLILPALSREPRYAVDEADTLFTGGGNGPYYGIRAEPGSRYSLRYLLAVLCHPLSEAMVRTRTSVFRGGYYSHGKQFIQSLPIPDPGAAVRAEIDAIVTELVQHFDELEALRLPAQRDRKERDIAHLRVRIEDRITSSFGLTVDELAAVKAVPIPD